MKTIATMEHPIKFKPTFLAIIFFVLCVMKLWWWIFSIYIETREKLLSEIRIFKWGIQRAHEFIMLIEKSKLEDREKMLCT